jgi:hypothetical protein
VSNLNLVNCNQVEGSKSLKNSFPIQEIPYLEELKRRSHWIVRRIYNCYIIIDINYIVTYVLSYPTMFIISLNIAIYWGFEL